VHLHGGTHLNSTTGSEAFWGGGRSSATGSFRRLIKQLFLDYQAIEVPFRQALKKEPWGARTFVVSDLDENLLLFAGPAD
jgi:hypothetical protein